MSFSVRILFAVCLVLSVTSACDRPTADNKPQPVPKSATADSPDPDDSKAVSDKKAASNTNTKTVSETPSQPTSPADDRAQTTNIPTLADSNASTDGQAAANSNESEASAESITDDADLAEFADPAFDTFVDLKLVRGALAELDPGLLVDVMLQTAEGENVLKRERKGFSAESLFDVALRVASDARDKPALKRLAKAAEKLGKADFVQPIEMAIKLADAPRKVDPGPKVPLRELTPEAMVLFKTFVREIKICRACGDRRGLENLRVTIVQLDGLHPRQQEYLTEKLIDGLAAVPAEPDPSSATLAQLAGVARRSEKSPDASGERPESQSEKP